MAVKTIEGPPEFTVRKACSGCKAVLEATKSDLQAGEFGAMGDYDWSVFFECPHCHSCVHVKVPSALEYRLIAAARTKKYKKATEGE